MDEDFHPALFSTPEAAEQSWYDALERADLAAAMACWSDEDDIVCIHPNGPRLIGIDPIRQSYEEILSQGPLTARVTRRHVQQNMLVAVHSVIEEMPVLHPRTGQPLRVFATNIYFKTPSGWRLVLHHASPNEEPMGDMPALRPSMLH
ncbi:YybH family protein [Derxia gummosa]|uniref:YybH family protein n=1 Tax=Derxia gummosa DSM 723 TaxID=1121388 RepID=A0A8B6X2I7_9BURK|nr:nuclear transport factor 2 family protein [Derxia gummosa]